MLRDLLIPLQMAPLLLRQIGPQRLDRIPEQSLATTGLTNVSQYDQVLSTKLVLAYAVGLEAAYRALPALSPNRLLDLGTGPGHLTLLLQRYLRASHVTGIDLSAPMVELANSNGRRGGVGESVQFKVGDFTDLSGIETASIDCCCCTDALHHLPDLQHVASAIAEIDRVTKPEGMVLLMDLARLKNRQVTERYVRLLASDYHSRGLPDFYDDFYHSMFAAWTVDELATSTPMRSGRDWWQLAPYGLPTIQLIVGVPSGRRRPLIRRGLPWASHENPVPPAMRFEWRAMRASIFNFGWRRRIRHPDTG